MSWCAVFGCSNESKNTKEKNISFFSLPKDKNIRDQWLAAIKRTNLPMKVFVCSDHFTDDCFGASWRLQNELLGSGSAKRKLEKGSVPTLFSYTQKEKPREGSLRRQKKAEKQQLITIALANQQESVDVQELCVEEQPKMIQLATQSDVSTKSISIQTVDLKIKNSSVQVRPNMKHCSAQTVNVRPKLSIHHCERINIIGVSDLSQQEEEQQQDDDEDEDLHMSENIESIRNTITKSTLDPQRLLDMLGLSSPEPVISSSLCAKSPIQSTPMQKNVIMSEDDEYNDEWLEKSEQRQQRHDADFDPNTYDFEDYENINLVLNTDTSLADRTFLVFESNLKQLMRFCFLCGGVIDSRSENENEGSQVTYKLNCVNGCNATWSTQPKLSSVRGVGNVFVVAATEMAGITYTKIRRFATALNLKFIEESNYYKLRSNYVFPEIDKAWKRNKKEQYDEIKKQSKPIEIGVDGQCDTPGHSATYCTVTGMNVATNKVLDFKIVHVKEVKNSQGMEKEGFVRLLSAIQDKTDVRAVSTDRHNQIRKLMRCDPRFKAILHQFDPWHIAKSVRKHIFAASKKKGCEVLALWLPAIINHLYWAITTCGGSGTELRERFTSIVFHVTNKHRWIGNKLYKKCEHKKLSDTQIRKTKWIKPGTAAHVALRKVILQKQLRIDVEKMNEMIYTTYLEVFHGMKIRYLPKSIYYGMEKMIAGTQLAALDHNNNIDRPQSTGKEGDGVKLFKIAYSKVTKRFAAKKVKVKKDYSYLRVILGNIYKRVRDSKKCSNSNRQKRKLLLQLAPTDKPIRKEVIEGAVKYSRLDLNNRKKKLCLRIPISK